MNIPKYVFIVPYRNRPHQKYFFLKYLTSIIPKSEKYEIFISNQVDMNIPFNRGAVKNIGFLAVKKKYPNHYKNIVLVFNDIDLVPFKNILNYNVTHGTVKHFYGFTYALGGILSITGCDFEATNGFPNFWGWGMEDHVFQLRCQRIGLKIDRSDFYPLGSPEIIHLFDGVSRIINPKESKDVIHHDSTLSKNGLRSIKHLLFSINKDSVNKEDNVHVIKEDNTYIVNIKNFDTGIDPNTNTFHEYDLRDPIDKITNPTNNPVPINKQVPLLRMYNK